MIFSKSVLPNGARVLIEHMPEVRSVSLGFWIAVGARDEPEELQGSSHFLEHLLFKGTASRSAREIAEAFDRVGGDVNAFSSKEYTCFYGRVLTEDLPMAREILTDMLCRGALRSEDIESERNVILEEIAMRDDAPEELVHDLFAETLFQGHPLGREVMGTQETIRAMTQADLRKFYDSGYHPANFVIAAAGNVDQGELLGWVEENLPPSGGAPNVRTPQPPPVAKALRVSRRETEQAHMVLGGLGYSRHHPDRFAWGVLDNILGGGSSSRLFQEIRERRGLAYSVYSYRNHFSETGNYSLYAGAAPSNAKEVLRLMGEELDRMVDLGPTEEEVERAKGYTKGATVLSLEDPASRMSRLGRSELMHGVIMSIDEIIARVEAVTPDDVHRVGRDLFPREKRVLTVIGPFDEEDFAG